MPPRKPFTHSVHLYASEEKLVSSLVDYFKVGIEAQETCIIIATPDHRTLLEDRLVSLGFNISFLEMLGKYIALDAKQTLSYFMKDGMPNEQSFSQVVGNLLPYMPKQPIRAYGEMVALLWEDGNKQGAIELEKMWNKMGNIREFSLFCAYPEHILLEDFEQSVTSIHGTHSHVVA